MLLFAIVHRTTVLTNDLCMYRDAYDLAQTRNYKEFDKISVTE